MLIEQPARLMRFLYPRAMWRINRHARVVYLTFDDGPTPEATPFILDTLHRYGIRATFFIVGDNARKYPELFEAIKEAGHRIGNHTMHHLNNAKTDSVEYVRDVTQANVLLRTNLVRPPHGWMRMHSYMRLTNRYRVVMWDVVTRDYSCLLTAEDVYNNVKRYVRNGSIITFHDSIKSIDKLKSALPASIEWLRSQGYAFKIIP